MDKSAESNLQKATSTPQTDDESITTSTESDSLETWTLVNGKNKKINSLKSTYEENRPTTNDGIETLTNDDSLANDSMEINESVGSRTDEDSNIDDVSEGISIISESESAGRASPLAIVDNLNSANFDKYSKSEDVVTPASMLRLPIHITQSSYELPSASLDENTLRQRRIRRSSAISERNPVKLKNNRIEETIMVYPLVRRGLKGAFFLCVALAILAFIGKLRNPDWQPFFETKTLSALEQKLTDLELQNNLMRAEIDILSKQVNYLSTLSESGGINRNKAEGKPNQQHRLFKQTGEWIMKQKGKAFKAWPGNGDSIDPVQITKNNLKNPYKCPNGKFVEIANMCIEKTDEKTKNFEDVVLEQIAESMQSLKKESVADASNNANINKLSGDDYKAAPKDDDKENRNKHFINQESRNSKEHGRQSTEKKYDTEKNWKQRKHLHRNIDDDDDVDDFSEEDEDLDDSLEDMHKKRFTSKETYKKHEHDRSDSRKRKERSQNEYHKGRHYNDRSKVRHSNENSKENIYISPGERSRNNGDWHGKLMQQRENARFQNDNRQRNKNWLIERGDSREEMRYGR